MAKSIVATIKVQDGKQADFEAVALKLVAAVTMTRWPLIAPPITSKPSANKWERSWMVRPMYNA